MKGFEQGRAEGAPLKMGPWEKHFGRMQKQKRRRRRIVLMAAIAACVLCRRKAGKR